LNVLGHDEEGPAEARAVPKLAWQRENGDLVRRCRRGSVAAARTDHGDILSAVLAQMTARFRFGWIGGSEFAVL
jgi:hypothetical protein